MNNDSTVHRRILQSIYIFMTKNSSCPRYGTHWEEVGFQVKASKGLKKLKKTSTHGIFKYS